MVLNCSVFSSQTGEVGTVFAETSGNFDDGESNVNALHWAYSNHTLTISKNSGNGAMPDFESVADNGNEAVRPAWEATYKNDIEIVVFENGITTIGAYLFFDEDWTNVDSLYPNLKVVILNGTITSIGAYAFAYCSNLERFNSNRKYECIIPDSVGNIVDSAFCHLMSIKYLKIGKNAKNVEGNIFYELYNCEEVYFNAINFTYSYCDFEDLANIPKKCKLTIGPDVTNLDARLFTCTESEGYYVTEILVDSNNTKY